MQFAKDSFFLALQERLSGLNPERVVRVQGATVAAVLVVENLPPACGEQQPNTFYVEWGSAEAKVGSDWNCGLMSLDVAISYSTLGTVASMVDRGRMLGQLDRELLSICQPPNTEKRDYTQSPSADLGTRVFWSQPSFPVVEAGTSGMVDGGQDARLERKALLTMYFFPEGGLS